MMQRLNGWSVVALWGAFNALFVLLDVGFVLGGFGRSVFNLEASGAMVLLVFAFAGMVWLGLGGRRPARAASPCSPSARSWSGWA